MAENKVVLASELGLYNGDDCLKITTNGFQIPSLSNMQQCSWSGIIDADASDGNIALVGGAFGMQFGLNNTKEYISFLVGDGSAWVSSVTQKPVIAGVNNITAVADGTNITVTINGDVQIVPYVGIPPYPNTCYVNSGSGGRQVAGLLYSVGVNEYTWIKKGDFGSPTIDSTPSGVNIPMPSNSTWWKKDIDQYFTTPLLYRSQLPSTPEMVQRVIDVDADAPPTGDSYWGLYTEEWLTVTKQSSGGQFGMRNMRLRLSLSL